MTNYRTKKGAAELQSAIDRYFASCDALNDASQQNAKKLCKPYTLAGLLCAVGLSHEEFEELGRSCRRLSRVISAARLRVESFIEENALCGTLSATAAANTLKFNFGWGDKETADGGALSGKLRVILDADAASLAE